MQAGCFQSEFEDKKPRPLLLSTRTKWMNPWWTKSRFYDLIPKLTGADRTKRLLLDQAALATSQRVLDIGCGTGTLAVLVKRLPPDVAVVGFDPDPKALARARKKAGRAGISVWFDQGFADESFPRQKPDRSSELAYANRLQYSVIPTRQLST
jgi:SAM-dependent methyltransferase